MPGSTHGTRYLLVKVAGMIRDLRSLGSRNDGSGGQAATLDKKKNPSTTPLSSLLLLNVYSSRDAPNFLSETEMPTIIKQRQLDAL